MSMLTRGSQRNCRFALSAAVIGAVASSGAVAEVLVATVVNASNEGTCHKENNVKEMTTYV